MAGCRPDPVAHQLAGEALAHRERELAERDAADTRQDVPVPRARVALQRARREVRLGPVGPPFLACEVGEQHLAAVERGDLAHAPASAHLGVERLGVALATDDARPVPARFSPSHSPVASRGLLDAHGMRPPWSGGAIVRPRGRRRGGHLTKRRCIGPARDRRSAQAAASSGFSSGRRPLAAARAEVGPAGGPMSCRDGCTRAAARYALRSAASIRISSGDLVSREFAAQDEPANRLCGESEPDWRRTGRRGATPRPAWEDRRARSIPG